MFMSVYMPKQKLFFSKCCNLAQPLLVGSLDFFRKKKEKYNFNNFSELVRRKLVLHVM